MIFQNYHRHSDYTNPKIADAVVKNEAYAKRAQELGHGIISTMEHGWQGRYIEGYELAQKYNLKFVFGTEAYWVKERLSKDSANCHVCIFARNESGRQQINDILSEANLSGVYYQARLDLDLIFSLNKDNVIITSACIAGWKYFDMDKIVERFKAHFGDSYYLEVQYHNTERQKELNERILRLSEELGINIIMGCDSHYINENQNWERDDYIKSKGIDYADEEGWFMDYPDGETAFNRFVEQGVLSKEQIKSAMNNTNVFLSVEEYHNPCFDKEIKMPTLYPELSQSQKDKKLIDIISEAWEKEKQKIPAEKHKLYYEEISKELQIVLQTKFSDYFLLDYELVKLGKAKNGMITPSGRGSSISFFINKLLGLTMVDRISAEVKMYPERFMSATRIIESKGIPDIDLNFGEVAPFAQAQEELLGEDHVKPMLAYGTMQPKAAWKMYAKSQGVDLDVSNEVSKQIENYEFAVKRANTEEEKDELVIEDYIDEKYKILFEGSKIYQGIISDYKIAPCGYLLYQGNIRKEIGLIKIKDNLCCVVDGRWAEDYKFLKNDLLKVSVVDLIYRIYRKLNLPMHEVDELIKLCPVDSKVWDVYKNGWTLGINQVEQVATKGRAMAYKPANISELSAFVAAVRPGFKSMYKTFESREPFSYGIKSLDNLIQTPQFPQSFIMYQEMQMAVLNYAGIPMTECYQIIKNIAKKRVEEVTKYKDIFRDGFNKVMTEQEGKTEEDAKKITDKIWQILEDSARYSFNACFSKDTKIQRAGGTCSRFQPTLEEMFKIKNDREYAIQTKHKDLYEKYKRYGYGNALSMFPDGRIKQNNIVDIFQSGIRQTYKITTSTSCFVVCTDNHKFPTPKGEKKLFELKVGDEVFIKGAYEKTNLKHNYTNGDFESNIPKKGEMGFQRRENGASVIYLAYRKQKQDNEDVCEHCGAEYKKGFELHHSDGDSTNNVHSNYEWLCNSCHKKAHYKMNRTKVYGKGSPVELDTIVSIEETGVEMVYDIEMADPAHNVVSESGLVASNSHSYSTAVDSLYGAYLKTTYPKEYYECFLHILEEKGEKNRMSATKAEAESAFGIYFPPMKFRQDNRDIRASEITNEITNSLTSIKGFSKSVAENLYNIRNIKFDNFIEFLVYLEDNGMMSKQIQDLVKIQYFSEFGGNAKLLEAFEMFSSGKNVRYSSKLTPETKRKRKELLLFAYERMEDKNVSFAEQLVYDAEILGSVQTTYETINRRYSYVVEIDTKYAPRAELYCLQNGKRSSVKIQKKIFASNPFKRGDVLFGKKFEQKPTVKMVDGEWEKDGTTTWWLSDYTIVKEIDEIVKVG